MSGTGKVPHSGDHSPARWAQVTGEASQEIYLDDDFQIYLDDDFYLDDDMRLIVAEKLRCGRSRGDSGVVSCVHYIQSGSTYYVSLLNNDTSVDNSATYWYTCLVIDYTASPVYASQWPRRCNSSQTATSVPSSRGYTFEMYTNLSGSSSGTGSGAGTSSSTSSSSGISWVPIVAAVVGFIALVAVVVGGYLLVKKMEMSRPGSAQVDPMTVVIANSQAPMDGMFHHDRKRLFSVNGMEQKRNSAVSPTTGNSISVNHMQTEFADDALPRLPPLQPLNPRQVADMNGGNGPVMPHKLPPINLTGQRE